MTLTAFTTASTLCGLAAAQSPGRRAVPLAALSGLFAAAGTLSKGPVGLLFPLTFLACDRITAWIGSRDSVDGSPSRSAVSWTRVVLAGLASYLLPVAAWIAAIGTIAGLPYVVEILFKQNVTRYVAAWNNI